ncbi:unnamed protein product [Peronospora destructor]|uniref:Uncharacterized protein n=1 Tax=Peronospora destructor TaxID=86335 RepID=A0AAV0UMA7_9STRA|nr:unnamed protein product [Peronospora destructor]
MLAPAIVVAGTDILAATSVKLIQAGDAPIKRLLRSETSVGVDGEERGLSSFLKSLGKSPAESSYTRLEKVEEEAMVEEAATVVNSARQSDDYHWKELEEITKKELKNLSEDDLKEISGHILELSRSSVGHRISRKFLQDKYGDNNV